PARSGNRPALIGCSVFAPVVLTAFIGPRVVPQSQPADVRAIYQAPSWAHLLGTDSEGRDILVQMINGGQTIITVGAIAALMSTFISSTFCALAAYVGGLVASVI